MPTPLCWCRSDDCRTTKAPGPYDMANVSNAAIKAQRLGARWSATSDAATLVLLDNSRSGPLISRTTQRQSLDRRATRSELDVPAIRDQIRAAWVHLIVELVPLLRGDKAAAAASPDEFFVESLRALLARPVAAIRDAISERKDSNATFRDSLVKWMVQPQGWSHTLAQFEPKSRRRRACPPMSSRPGSCSLRH